jgi:hypothetical protein
VRKLLLSVVGSVLLVFASAGAASSLGPSAQAHGQSILEFETMVGVSGPYVGSANPIRGVNGGGLPWVISRGEGQLSSGGRLEMEVRGLVLANDPAVPANLRLTNPIPSFRVLVSCLSIAADGSPSTVNVSTGNFPASPRGNAEIEARVNLPHPCFAPLVFVTSPGGSWFAVTGSR